MFARCKRCGDRLPVFAKKDIALCRSCREFVDKDVLLRKSEIRKAMAGLRFGGAGRSLLFDEAHSHLRVLLHYENRGVAKIRPAPSEILNWLEALSEPPKERARSGVRPREAAPSGASGFDSAQWFNQASPGVQFFGAESVSPFVFDAVHADRQDREPEASGFWLGEEPEPSPAKPTEWLSQEAPRVPFHTPEPVPPLVVSAARSRGVSPGAGAGGREERRRSERRPVEFKLSINPFGSQAVARDLSSTGIYIQTGLRKTWRTPIRLVFQTTRGEIETVGVVRRAVRFEGVENGAARDGLAIQFVEALDSLPQFIRAVASFSDPGAGLAA